MISSIEYREHRIEVHMDPNPMNPLEWDSIGIMLCSHPRYDLGREKGLTPEEIEGRVKSKDVVVAIPLYLLDHSGLRMRTRQFPEDPGGWDTSMVGYITVTRGRVREVMNVKRITKAVIRKVKALLQREVEVYSCYLNGEVYGFVIEGPVVSDAVWGYYGDTGYKDMIEEAKSCVDQYYKQVGEQLTLLPQGETRKGERDETAREARF